jgi:crotonobetainyl-CoA:carnitine CoA-transferase CaiB-like acyl-CoA transferase
VTYAVPPPLLGQHTREVLGGVLGLSDDQIAALSAQGIV